MVSVTSKKGESLNLLIKEGWCNVASAVAPGLKGLMLLFELLLLFMTTLILGKMALR